MDNCIIKIILIAISVAVLFTGLYLSFIREKKNISKSESDLQTGTGDIKSGKFSFQFALGPLLILIGLSGAFYSANHIECENKNENIKVQEETANLRFTMEGNDTTKTILFIPKLPKWKDQKYIARQADQYFLIENIDLPSKTDLFFAKIQPQITSPGTYKSSATVDPIKIGFVRKDAVTIPDDKCIAVIKYAINHKIVLDEGDRGCVILRDSTKLGESHSLSIFPSAFAQTHIRKYPGWSVPSLYTLEKQNLSGFSKVIIKSLLLPQELKKANKYSYVIKVNKVPIYIDGLLPDDLAKSFSFANGINLALGLENLGFTGNNKGYENIEVELRFYCDESLIKATTLTLDFVALRKLEAQKIKADDGFLFQWEAYFKANNENQIFISSTPDVKEITKIKEKIDGRKLFYNNQKIVGIIRPPYKSNKNYGLNAGIVLSSGQTKFTFNNVDAEKLKKFLVTQGYGDLLIRPLKDN